MKTINLPNWVGIVLAVAVVGILHALDTLHAFGASPFIVGMAYASINATTAAELVAANPKVREELWVRSILMGADHLYQENPFADNFTGPAESRKPVVTITDTEKVEGNTVNVPTIAGFGGPGVAGEGNRIGSEQKIKTGNFPVKIGRFWFGVGFTAISRDETVIGGRLDTVIKQGLKLLHAKKRSDDNLMRLIQATTTVKGARNLIFPDGVGSRADIVGEFVFDTASITKIGDLMPSIGAIPMNITKDPTGSPVEKFTIFATHRALRPLQNEPTYVDAVQNGQVRGDSNNNFTGEFVDWLGHGLYRWYMKDHSNKGPVGSPLEPRALLGAAITGATTGTIIQGGGWNYDAADSPAPQYFEFFSNAPYTFYNGDTIAAVTNVTRWLQIINPDGTYGTFPYQVNDGNKITLSGGALAVGAAGKRTTNFVQNAVVVECNAAGQAFGRILGLGAQALACGTGSINGSKSSPQMGTRTEEHRNHNMDHAIGAEGVWGNQVVARHDGTFPGFVVMETALIVPGAPQIVA
jgi:hypothetical protein